MPPIPIYADAPITAAKADGTTPQTAAAPPPTRTVQEAPTTTTSSSTTSNYPAAQPGAAAMPAPTSSIPQPQAAPTRTMASTSTNGPPPPQPGAVPVPPTTFSASNTNTPAPPRAFPMPMPHQLNIPPPTTNHAATHSTTAASPIQHTATTIPLGTVPHQRHGSISAHPPGYVQNPYAAEMTSAQRASLEAAEAAERGNRSGRNSISEFFSADGGRDGFDAAGASPTTARAWDAVKGLGSSVGAFAAKAEGSIWKKFG